MANVVASGDGRAPEPIAFEQVHLSPPHVEGDEIERLVSALQSNWIAPTGPDLRRFESELAERCGSSHAVGVSSGSAAIHLSLLALGVERGDEVFCASFTFAGSAFPIEYIGATPTFIDSERKSWNVDPDLVEQELIRRSKRNQLPKALIAVDLYGETADYARLQSICRRFEVPIVEDAAEALGATHDIGPAGSLGDVGIVSFNGNKIITASAGGVLLTDSDEVAATARFLASQAKEPEAFYLHNRIGFNYGMSNLLAALGSAQLATLDSKIEARTRNFEFYSEVFESIDGVEVHRPANWGSANHWLTCVTFDDGAKLSNEELRQLLASENIESRRLWKPMHQQPVFASASSILNGVSDELFDVGLCLPSGSSLSESDRDRIAEVANRALT